jgi:hypothetical protein
MEDVRTLLSESPGVIHWRNNVGRAKLTHGPGWIDYGLCVGSADLIACVPTCLACPACGAELPPIGRFVGIETKRPAGGRITDDQIQWLRLVSGSYGVVSIVNSVEGARLAIHRARTQWQP